MAIAVWPIARAEAQPPLKKLAAVEGITEYELANGLRVLLFPDDSRPTVTVNLTVLVGSRHEGYGETGMAHLLEHLVFKGTPTHQNVPQALKQHGAVFNGSTSYDLTNYYETMPASDANLEFGIQLEADRLVNSFIRLSDLLSEMTVVRNEFEMGENSPFLMLYMRIMSAAFEWHNYGKSTIGNRTDLERVPIDSLQAFYRKHYQPDNALLVIAGRFDETKALEYVQKYFGAIPRPERKLVATYTEEPAQDGERLVTLRRVGNVSLTGAAYHIPAGPHPDFPAIQVLGQLLTEAPSGRLYRALVESRKCASVQVFAMGLHDPGAILFVTEMNKDIAPKEVETILLKELEEFSANPPTAEEVQRARKQILNQRERAAANTTELAVSLSNWAAQGDWRLYFLHRDRLENVAPDDVLRVAKTYLQQNNRTLGYFLPTERAERVTVPATPDFSKLVHDYQGKAPVAAGERFDAAPDHIEARTQRTKLPSGIEVALLPKKTRGETVTLALTLRYGNAENLKGLVEACEFLPDLMWRGTKDLNHQQIQDELEKLSAVVDREDGEGNESSKPGVATFYLKTKREHVPQALRLFEQVLREPSLPTAEFELLKQAQLASLEQLRSEPTALATFALNKNLAPYPEADVRYVPTLDEKIRRIESLTVEEVRKLYADYLGAAHGELTVVGDFDPQQTLELMTTALNGWKPKLPYARLETQLAKVDGKQQVIATPDKANAIYCAGMLIPVRDDDADYPALMIANYILGSGGLSSRLGDRVRQKEGLSYGVFSSLQSDSQDRWSLLSIYAMSNPQNMERVVECIQEEVARMARDGITPDELAQAKQGYLEQQKVRWSSDQGLLGTLGHSVEVGRTMEHYARLNQKIEALTPEQVVEVFRKYVDPQRLVIVTAGDFDSLKNPEKEQSTNK